LDQGQKSKLARNEPGQERVFLMDDDQTLNVGDRFKMSALGAERSPGLAKKVGTIIQRCPHSRVVTVRFDGNKYITLLYRDYIAPLEDSSK